MTHILLVSERGILICYNNNNKMKSSDKNLPSKNTIYLIKNKFDLSSDYLTDFLIANTPNVSSTLQTETNTCVYKIISNHTFN